MNLKDEEIEGNEEIDVGLGKRIIGIVEIEKRKELINEEGNGG